MDFDPKRTVAELKELRALTGDENGAQRVAFTPTWSKARTWLCEKLSSLPVEIHTDAAGNLWTTLRGASEGALLIGGHLDSVPNGGWLDGCLNVLAGVEILRRIHAQYSGQPPVTVRLVDWADEEGARFGKSLFGSSACSGNLNLEEARRLQDKDGIGLPDALKKVGIDFECVKESGQELENAAAYLELHIEQGPVLLDLDLPLGVVLGTCGVERHAITFRGQAAHSGSTPMNRRRDAFLGGAQMSPEIYRIAARHGGVCTIGSCTTKPGIVTSVIEECQITLDQRHLDAAALARMLQEARAASERFAREGASALVEVAGAASNPSSHQASVCSPGFSPSEITGSAEAGTTSPGREGGRRAGEGRDLNLSVTWNRLWQIEPVLFHPRLVDLCGQAIVETCGRAHRLPSGPLHDAAEVARAGVPTVMMFVQSLLGISHNKIEDTREEHLELAVSAFDKLAEKTINWMQSSP